MTTNNTLTINNKLFTIADSLKIIDDFTETTIITSSSIDDEVSSVKKFPDTAEVTLKTVTTINSESPTLRSNESTNPLSRENYTVKCFEKICTTTSPKNLGKCS